MVSKSTKSNNIQSLKRNKRLSVLFLSCLFENIIVQNTTRDTWGDLWDVDALEREREGRVRGRDVVKFTLAPGYIFADIFSHSMCSQIRFTENQCLFFLCKKKRTVSWKNVLALNFVIFLHKAQKMSFFCETNLWTHRILRTMRRFVF